MRATGINHVSIGARDIEASTRFYQEVFGLERIPSPTFQVPVVWLRLGDLQLHLFQRGDEAPVYHHLGIDVDDFEGAYLTARDLGVLDGETWGGPVRELPDGSVQMYIRDPSGNLIEVDWPDVNTVDHSIVPVQRLHESIPQRDDAHDATLYLERAQ